jgi:hypothetical protein
MWSPPGAKVSTTEPLVTKTVRIGWYKTGTPRFLTAQAIDQLDQAASVGPVHHETACAAAKRPKSDLDRTKPSAAASPALARSHARPDGVDQLATLPLARWCSSSIVRSDDRTSTAVAVVQCAHPIPTVPGNAPVLASQPAYLFGFVCDGYLYTVFRPAWRLIARTPKTGDTAPLTRPHENLAQPREVDDSGGIPRATTQHFVVA